VLRGGAGVYVSDLWVAPEARGSGLGRRLLGAVREDADRVWGVCFLKLAAYVDNPASLAFYARLGFLHHEHERYLTLDAAGLAALGETE
jgi:ribosomal protein S18 acetylase RimI-like enzyme